MLKYLIDLFFAMDRFLNALAGGSPLATISARVGYHITEKPHWHSRFWAGLAFIVDQTFLPLDGRGHCVQAYARELDGNSAIERGSDFSRVLLGIIISSSCLILFPLIRVVAYFNSDLVMGE